MNLDKPTHLKINTSIKLDENNKLINKSDMEEPVCIDVKSKSTELTVIQKDVSGQLAGQLEIIIYQ